jgi:hypothetical protein
VVRDSLPDELVAFLDAEDAASLSSDLRVLRDAAERSGFGAAVEGMVRSLGAANVELSAAVAASGDEAVTYDRPVDLSVYDEVWQVLDGSGHDAA